MFNNTACRTFALLLAFCAGIYADAHSEWPARALLMLALVVAGVVSDVVAFFRHGSAGKPASGV